MKKIVCILTLGLCCANSFALERPSELHKKLKSDILAPSIQRIIPFVSKDVTTQDNKKVIYKEKNFKPNSWSFWKTFHSNAGIESSAFSQDDSMLAILSEDGIIKIWDITTQSLDSEPLAQLPCQRDIGDKTIETGKVTFNPDGKTVISYFNVPHNQTKIGLLTVWKHDDNDNFTVVKSVTTPVRFNSSAVFFSEDNKKIIVQGSQGPRINIYLIDLATGALEKVIPIQNSTLLISYNASTHDVAVIKNGAVQLWSLDSGKQTAEFPNKLSYLNSTAFDPRKTQLQPADIAINYVNTPLMAQSMTENNISVLYDTSGSKPTALKKISIYSADTQLSLDEIKNSNFYNQNIIQQKIDAGVNAVEPVPTPRVQFNLDGTFLALESNFLVTLLIDRDSLAMGCKLDCPECPGACTHITAPDID